MVAQFYRAVMDCGKRAASAMVADRLHALADAADGDVAVVEHAAQNALVDIDALDLVQRHLEGTPLDEAELVHHPPVGDVGLGGQRWNQARSDQYRAAAPPRNRAEQPASCRSVPTRRREQRQKDERHDPGQHGRKINDPMALVEYSTFSPGCRISLDIARHQPQT